MLLNDINKHASVSADQKAEWQPATDGKKGTADEKRVDKKNDTVSVCVGQATPYNATVPFVLLKPVL